MEREIQPVIIEAEYASMPSFLFLVFDIPMIQVDIDASNLFFRAANRERPCTFLNWVSPTRCRFSTAQGDPNIGDPIVSYIGSEMEFLSSVGIIAEKWTDFPVNWV